MPVYGWKQVKYPIGLPVIRKHIYYFCSLSVRKNEIEIMPSVMVLSYIVGDEIPVVQLMEDHTATYQGMC